MSHPVWNVMSEFDLEDLSDLDIFLSMAEVVEASEIKFKGHQENDNDNDDTKHKESKMNPSSDSEIEIIEIKTNENSLNLSFNHTKPKTTTTTMTATTMTTIKKNESRTRIFSIPNFRAVSKTVQMSISQFFRPPKRLPPEEGQENDNVESDKRKCLSSNENNLKPKASSSSSFSSSNDFKAKKVPRFKLIPGTPFSVDAFSYGPLESITGHFLTHFHSDHYKGLSNKTIADGSRLYCSEVTGNLVKKELKIREEVITILKLGHLYIIEGIHVGVLDANQ